MFSACAMVEFPLKSLRSADSGSSFSPPVIVRGVSGKFSCPLTLVAVVGVVEVGIRSEPNPVAALGTGSRLGVHPRRSSSASLSTWRAWWACSNGGRVSPGTTGVSSSRFRSRRPWRASMICFSARSIVAAKCTS